MASVVESQAFVGPTGGGDGAERSYDLTGPESLTQAQQVAILGETLGRNLTVEDLDPQPVLEQLSRFMDPEFLAALFTLMAQAVGKPRRSTTSSSSSPGTRHAPTPGGPRTTGLSSAADQ